MRVVVPGLHQPGEVGADALDPHRVGVVNQERAGAQPWKGLLHAAARVEQHAPLVGNLDRRCAARLQMRLDQVGLVVHVHDARADAGLGVAVEHVVDQRLAVERHQRLGQAVAGGRHARAEAGAQHHRRRDPLPASHPSPQPVASAQSGSLPSADDAGKCLSYHAASGASAAFAQVALQISPDARHVREILRLAVAPRQAHENAQELRVALGAEVRRRRTANSARRRPARAPSTAAQ